MAKLRSINPNNGKEFGSVKITTKLQLEEAVKKARVGLVDWGKLGLVKRGKMQGILRDIPIARIVLPWNHLTQSFGDYDYTQHVVTEKGEKMATEIDVFGYDGTLSTYDKKVKEIVSKYLFGGDQK